jgi:hypothetical protein
MVTEQAATDRTVVGRSFVATDAEGKRRAYLGVSNGEPMLSLLDGNGKVRAALRVELDMSLLQLFDALGNELVEISAEEHGPGIRLFGKDGKPAMALLVTGDSTTSVSQIFLLDANGRHSLWLEGTSSGEPSLQMSDANRTPRFRLALSSSGGPQLALHDANGKPCVIVTALDDGPSMILMDPANAHGNTSARIQVSSGAPFLNCIKDGKVLWSAP